MTIAIDIIPDTITRLDIWACRGEIGTCIHGQIDLTGSQGDIASQTTAVDIRVKLIVGPKILPRKCVTARSVKLNLIGAGSNTFKVIVTRGIGNRGLNDGCTALELYDGAGNAAFSHILNAVTVAIEPEPIAQGCGEQRGVDLFGFGRQAIDVGKILARWQIAVIGGTVIGACRTRYERDLGSEGIEPTYQVEIALA